MDSQSPNLCYNKALDLASSRNVQGGLILKLSSKHISISVALCGAILVPSITFSKDEKKASKTPAKTDDISLTKNPVETRHIMTQMFTALTTVLPLSLDDSFSKPENREKILTELKRLRDSTEPLQSHTKPFEASFGYIAKAMERDIKDTYSRYQHGSYNEARFLLHQLSENCVSCHVKLPDPGHAPNMSQFFKDVNIAKLPPPERAKLQLALRQFDDAQKTWEDFFKTRPASELFAMDAVTEYLKVMIRVKQDPERAVQTLKSIAAKGNIPKATKRDVDSWIKSLESLKTEGQKSAKSPSEDELTRGRKIVEDAKKRMAYPMDRSGLVDFIVASGLLNRYLNESTSKPTPDQRAEAFYLLGTTESLIGRSTWLSQTDFYYESAIRAAPKSKSAGLAYDALEQQVMLEYSGSGGIHVPEDVRANLDELHRLVQGK